VADRKTAHEFETVAAVYDRRALFNFGADRAPLQ